MSNLGSINARMAQLTQSNTLALQQLTQTVTAQSRAAGSSMPQALQHALGALDHGLSEGVEKFGRIVERIDGAVVAVLDRVKSAFSSVLEATGISQAFGSLVSALDSKAVRTALEKIGQVVGVAAAPVMLLAKAAGEAAESLKGAGKKALGWLDTVTAPVTGKTTAGVQSVASGGTALVGETVKRSAGDITGAFGALAGAAGGVVGALTSIPGQVGRFVEAFAPATMERFNQIIREVTAVFGIAFEPIIETFTSLAEEVGSQLLPVMEQLRPIIAQLGGELMARLTPIIRLFANLMIDLMPLFKLFADLMSALTPLIQASVAVFGAIVRTIAQFLSNLFGGDGTKNVIDSFKKAIFEAAKGMVLLAAWAAKLFGMTDFVKNLKEGLGVRKEDKKDDLIGTAAATNASYSSFSEYGRQLTLAATMAGGKENDETQEDIWKGIRSRLDEILGSKTTLKALILEELPKAVAKAFGITVGDPRTDKDTYSNKIMRGGTSFFSGGLFSFDFKDAFDIGQSLRGD